MKKTSGITLLELLVASALVGIIMAGVVSVEFAIRRSRQTASVDMVLNAKIAAAMLQIARDAKEVTGDSSAQTPASEGIFEYISGNTRAICFRYYDPDKTWTEAQKIDHLYLYTDGYHPWTCYQHDATFLLRRCTGILTATPAEPPCTALNYDPSFQFKLENAQYPNGTNFFSIVRNGTGRIDYIGVSLIALADSSSATHNDLTNPRAELTSRINPFYLSH
jgi:type II secretory pathway pseudopilin PulG